MGLTSDMLHKGSYLVSLEQEDFNAWAHRLTRLAVWRVRLGARGGNSPAPPASCWPVPLAGVRACMQIEFLLSTAVKYAQPLSRTFL